MEIQPDKRPEYWLEYSNLQRVKHALISEYLKGWFPKVGSWAGRIVYLDTHAGRGRHRSGEEGSPLVALRTFIDHSHRDQILERSEVRFFFIERDAANVTILERELAALQLLQGVHVDITCDDCFQVIERLVTSLQESGGQLAPAFIFVDPYGFKVPGKLLRRLMSFPRVELFVNVIWRELDMAITQARKAPNDGMAATLDDIFDGRQWLDGIGAQSFDERSEQCVSLFRDMCAARWATWIRMLGENGATRYLLLHLTNHPAGRELMKDCIWRICPDGGFYARKSDNPAQELLITPEPNLTPLREWVLIQLSQQSRRWQDLGTILCETLWRQKHLNGMIQELKRSGVIDGAGFEGRFSRKSNPILLLK